MNSLDEIGITRERLQRCFLVGPEQLGYIILLPLQVREVEPGQRILEVPPNPFNGVELWTIRWQEHQAHVRGENQALGSMGPAVIEEQEIETRGKRLCKRVNEELKHRRIQIRQFQEEPVAGYRFHGAIDVEPFEDVLDGTDRLYAPRCEAPAANRQEAEPAFVLAEHPDGTNIVRRDRLLELGLTGRLEGRNGLKVFLCAWAVPL